MAVQTKNKYVTCFGTENKLWAAAVSKIHMRDGSSKVPRTQIIFNHQDQDNQILLDSRKTKNKENAWTIYAILDR